MGWLIQTLYVDDDPGLLDLAKEFLEGENDSLKVTTCSSAKDVLNILRNNSFDVIISDYQMPSMSGLDLLKELRSRGVDLPFILFTGRGREEVAIDALNNGADFYLSKGGNPRVQFTELFNLIQHMVLKRQAIDAVKHNAERFRAMIENSLDLITILNPDGVLRYVSPSIKKVLGHNPDQLMDRMMEDIIFIDDRERFQSMLRNGTNLSETTEFRLQKADGSLSYVEGSFSKMKDSEGRTSLIFNGRDITKRRLAEQRMRESEQMYRALFESSPDGIALVKGCIEECNQSIADMLGYKKEDLIGRTLMELVVEQPDDVLQQMARSRGLGPVEGIGPWRQKDGHQIVLKVSVRRVTLKGEQHHLLCFTSPTKEQAVERSGGDLERTCHVLLAASPDAVLVLDPSLDVRMVSGKAKAQFGEAVGRSIFDLLQVNMDDDLVSYLKSVHNGDDVGPHRLRQPGADGFMTYLQLTGSRICGDDGTVDGIVLMIRDITDSVLTEERSIATQETVRDLNELFRVEVEKRVTALSGHLQLLEFKMHDEMERKQVEMALDQTSGLLRFLDTTKAYQMVSTKPPAWMPLREIMDAVLGQVDLKRAKLNDRAENVELLVDMMFPTSLTLLLRHLLSRNGEINNIQVWTEIDPAGMRLMVRDDGLPYGPQDLERIFDLDGAGKGLRFLKEVCNASRMKVECRSLEDGVQFTMVAPEGTFRRH